MKRFFGTLMSVLLVLGLLPATLGVSVGSGVGVNINTEDFKPEIWMCDGRAVIDDNVEPGREHGVLIGGQENLTERLHNYAFEGEKVTEKVLVMDKNGINKVEDVYMTIGATQGEGNDIEVNCVEDLGTIAVLDECNARIAEENISTFDNKLMRYYDCTFTVETPDSMYGEYFVTAEATDLDGLSSIVRENEYWFLNPVVALSIDGELNFENARPGADAYSDTILVGNDADDGSGVMLDMFISGTDFYDSSSSGAMCPTTNQLALTNFRYYGTSGAYSTHDYNTGGGAAEDDSEGYVGIVYGDQIRQARQILCHDTAAAGSDCLFTDTADYADPADRANVLSPGSEMALTFKLSLPEPCNGDFDSGQIYFWGEAV